MPLKRRITRLEESGHIKLRSNISKGVIGHFRRRGFLYMRNQFEHIFIYEHFLSSILELLL